MPEHTPAPIPARSLYGFFMYLFSKITLVLYCIWAFIPDNCLHYFNIYYYPQKYWSTAVPIQFLVALTIFAFFIYPSANLILTYDIDSLNSICDTHSVHTSTEDKSKVEHNVICVCSDKQKCVINSFCLLSKNNNENSVPQLYDLDIRYVCKKLYFSNNKL